MQLTKEQLKQLEIKQWAFINEKFKESSLLLGNGFSLNFSDKFFYKNIYEEYIQKCSQDIKKLFTEFGSNNFEIILEHLESTERICKALQINQNIITESKSKIKNGLIESINTIHPKPDEIKTEQLKLVSNQLRNFDQIFTTNYDLYLYYLILENDKFGDYFYFNYFKDKRFNLFNEGDNENENHVYYLHGALFIFNKSIDTIKIKIKENEDRLIDLVTKEISNDNYPLFISEGTSEMKLNAIQSNKYLSYCFRQLNENINNKIVIFGQSLSEQDEHIIKSLDENYTNLAYGIRISNDKNFKELRAEVNRVRSLFEKTEIEFFDSSTLFKFN